MERPASGGASGTIAWIRNGHLGQSIDGRYSLSQFINEIGRDRSGHQVGQGFSQNNVGDGSLGRIVVIFKNRFDGEAQFILEFFLQPFLEKIQEDKIDAAGVVPATVQCGQGADAFIVGNDHDDFVVDQINFLSFDAMAVQIHIDLVIETHDVIF